MWKFLDRILRRLTAPAARLTPRRKGAPRRRTLLLEGLEDRCVPSGTSTITSSFTATAVSSGRYLWFNSAANVTGVGTNTVNIYVTNQTISYTDSTAGTFTLSVPNAVLTLSAATSTATTSFTNGQWVTTAPLGAVRQ